MEKPENIPQVYWDLLMGLREPDQDEEEYQRQMIWMYENEIITFEQTSLN